MVKLKISSGGNRNNASATKAIGTVKSGVVSRAGGASGKGSTTAAMKGKGATSKRVGDTEDTSTSTRAEGLEKKSKVVTLKMQTFSSVDQAVTCLLEKELATLKDKDGYLAADLFWDLPDRKEYADYYAIIKEPICLNDMKEKAKSGKYDKDLKDLKKDFQVLVQNAQLYNQPSSIIYHHASMIKTCALDFLDHVHVQAPEKTSSLKTPSSKRSKSNEESQSAPTSVLKRIKIRTSNASTPEPSTQVSTSSKETPKATPKGASNPVTYESIGQLCQLIMQRLRNLRTGKFRRYVASLFWHLPSRDDYPDYYVIVKEPICLTEIQTKGKTGSYDEKGGLSQLRLDIRQVILNARLYNDPSSEIYNDASRIETCVLDMFVRAGIPIKDLEEDTSEYELVKTSKPSAQETKTNLGKRDRSASTISPSSSSTVKRIRSSVGATSTEQVKSTCESVMKALKALRHQRRPVATLFWQLPLREDYPDYYRVIKKPICLDTIAERGISGTYKDLAALESDLLLLTSNAKQYNDPGSEVYHDATRLETCFRDIIKSSSASGDDLHVDLTNTTSSSSSTPSVASKSTPRVIVKVKDKKQRSSGARAPAALTQEETTAAKDLIRSLLQLKDHRRRTRATLFMTLPDRTDYQDYYRLVTRPISISMIQARLGIAVEDADDVADTGKTPYASMKLFAEDLIRVFENAKFYNQEQSQIYKDADVLLNRFRRLYNQYCDQIGIQALSEAMQLSTSTSSNASSSITTPAMKETKKADEKATDAETLAKERIQKTTLQCEGVTYTIGDFVYVPDDSEENKRNVVLIEKLWTDVADDILCFSGSWFLRPEQTYHLPYRRFYPNELFKATHGGRVESLLNTILGKCHVMHFREFSKFYPRDIPPEDVYVCESRYSVSGRCITQIKEWRRALPLASTVERDVATYVERETPLRMLKTQPSPLDHEAVVAATAAAEKRSSAASSVTASSSGSRSTTPSMNDKDQNGKRIKSSSRKNRDLEKEARGTKKRSGADSSATDPSIPSILIDKLTSSSSSTTPSSKKSSAKATPEARKDGKQRKVPKTDKPEKPKRKYVRKKDRLAAMDASGASTPSAMGLEVDGRFGTVASAPAKQSHMVPSLSASSSLGNITKLTYPTLPGFPLSPTPGALPSSTATPSQASQRAPKAPPVPISTTHWTAVCWRDKVPLAMSIERMEIRGRGISRKTFRPQPNLHAQSLMLPSTCHELCVTVLYDLRGDTTTAVPGGAATSAGVSLLHPITAASSSVTEPVLFHDRRLLPARTAAPPHDVPDSSMRRRKVYRVPVRPGLNTIEVFTGTVVSTDRTPEDLVQAFTLFAQRM